MCGIAGYWGSSFNAEEADAHLRRMGQAIAHRGPDDAGTWCDHAARIGLSHRRLSIVDLSAAGHQPMTAASGRYVMVFNGEIYNHPALRTELEKQGAAPQAWRGHSDTETLLAAIEHWGLEATLKKSVGMFALALWDRAHRSLSLVRDRMGEKPLYFGYAKGVFLFGSELAALRAHPAFDAPIDRHALALMLRYNHVPAPHSIYSGIHKLQPGCSLQLTEADLHAKRLPQPVAYWSLTQAIAQGQTEPFAGSEHEATDALESALREAIGLQMVADVPLGAFLSGGVDSSTVVALMQAQASRPVKTFTIGFHEQGFNEAEHAKAVARHLGTEHTELYVTPQQALDVIPHLPTLYSEPFADASQIPTYLVSALARQHVTVSLSGDGGDELFGGYNRYLSTPQIWSRFGHWPRPIRAALADLLEGVPTHAWDRVFALARGMAPAASHPGEKLHKIAQVLRSDSRKTAYKALASQWQDPYGLLREPGVDGSSVRAEPVEALSRELGDHIQPTNPFNPDQDYAAWMMCADTLGYLPDDILVKVDRAAMGVSLESRVPLLDHRVVELAWSLPQHLKIRQGQGKWLLRQVLDRHVPRRLIDRPKTGFAVPVGDWLRGPLREWAETLLDASRVRQQGLFNDRLVGRMWQQCQLGQGSWHYPLWNLLMFQSWLDASPGYSAMSS